MGVVTPLARRRRVALPLGAGKRWMRALLTNGGDLFKQRQCPHVHLIDELLPNVSLDRIQWVDRCPPTAHPQISIAIQIRVDCLAVMTQVSRDRAHCLVLPTKRIRFAIFSLQDHGVGFL